MNQDIKVEELLFNDEPLTINRKLAKCLGLKEAVIFQQIHYWLKVNEKKKNNYREGRYWTYNSLKKWHEEEFEFLSIRTIERILKSLEQEGLIITGMFNKMNGDKTKWYTINYNKLLEVAKNRLKRKDIISEKRSKSGTKGASIKHSKECANTDDTILPKWQDDLQCQSGNMVEPKWQNDAAKMAEAIPENSTKNSSKISCSSRDTNLIKIFEDNICTLGRSTKKKFLKFLEEEEEEYVLEVINYQASINTKSWAGFNKGIENFRENDIHSSEELKQFIDNYHKQKEVEKNNIEIEQKVIDEIKFYENVDFDKSIDLDKVKHLDNIKKDIKNSSIEIIGDINYNVWIKNLKIIEHNNEVIVIASSNFHREKIEKQYINLIKKTLMRANINGKLKLTYL